MDVNVKYMSVVCSGYKFIKLSEVPPMTKKINKVKQRDVYIHNDMVYKLWYEDKSYLIDIIVSGFYSVSPTLYGFIFDGSDLVGCAQYKCDSLSINRHDLDRIIDMLCDVYLKTGYVLLDFVSQNFGRYKNGYSLIDIEDVGRPDRFNNVHPRYKKFIDDSVFGKEKISDEG